MQPRDHQSAEEIERDIRRTRAEMSETVDAMERRLAPDRLKQHAKDTVHETIDEVRDRYHPQRLAQQAGNTMMDTIRDHPVPSLIAGLSVGYLLMKAGEGSGRRDSDYRYRTTGYAGRGMEHYDAGHRYEEEYGAPRRYRGVGDEYERPYRGDVTRGADDESEYGGDERSARDRAAKKAGRAQERASEWADEAQHRTREAGRQVRRQARRAQNGLDAFVHDNPLAAGAVAAGVGALLGSMLPSTEAEDEWMGPARDRAVRQARHAAEGTLERAQEAAGRVADEAKDAAQDVKATAKHEASGVKEEAKAQASDKM